MGITLSADDGLLYIGEDAIGIGCNSTYATVMEAVGYIFLKEFPKFRYGVVLDKDLTEDIKRYWVGKAALNKLKRAGVKAFFSEEELRIEAARRLRRYNDAELEEINAAFGLFGLNRAMTVRLATFFLIVVLSVIYVIGRGNNPEDIQSAPAGTVSEDAVSPDKEEGTQKKEGTADSVPTGGGEFGGEDASEEE